MFIKFLSPCSWSHVKGVFWDGEIKVNILGYQF
jgi:hypothetical protein